MPINIHISSQDKVEIDRLTKIVKSYEGTVKSLKGDLKLMVEGKITSQQKSDSLKTKCRDLQEEIKHLGKKEVNSLKVSK